MAGDVFWIKLHTGTFDSEAIMLLESMPEGDTILVVWIKLQILAGKCNAGGYLLLNGENPYSDEMLATVLRRPLNTVRLAIAAFLEFNMLEIIDGAYFLPEWEKYQNIRGLENIKEQNRLRVARHRAKKKNVTLHVTHSNVPESELELEPERQQQEIRLLLKNTPLCHITVSELKYLKDHYGIKHLKLAADIAAETWKRDKEEIINPGGYLNSFCSALIIPSWYKSPDDRRSIAQAIEEKMLTEKKAREEYQALEEKEALERETYWTSLSEADRDNFRRRAKESIGLGFELPSVAITAIAKRLAWSQMDA